MSSTTQLNLLLSQVWSLGRTLSGSSRLQIVTSTSFGKSSVSKVNWVPHCAQNERVPRRVDLKRVGSPAVKRNCERSRLNQATEAAPVVPRQIAQWQLVS